MEDIKIIKMEDNTPPAEKPIGPCRFCGALAEVKCANCKSVYYCDRNCQKRNWKEHKTACKQIKTVNEITIVEPLDAIDVSNLTLKVEVRVPLSRDKFVSPQGTIAQSATISDIFS